MNYNTKIRIIKTMFCVLSPLGFIRGLNSYDYTISKNQNPKIYTDKIISGVLGALYYSNPFTLFIVMYKEIYRLEVNIRGLEDQKNTTFYNKL